MEDGRKPGETEETESKGHTRTAGSSHDLVISLGTVAWYRLCASSVCTPVHCISVHRKKEKYRGICVHSSSLHKCSPKKRKVQSMYQRGKKGE